MLSSKSKHSLLMTTFQLNVHHQGVHGGEVPPFLQKIAFKFLARLLFVRVDPYHSITHHVRFVYQVSPRSVRLHHRPAVIWDFQRDHGDERDSLINPLQRQFRGSPEIRIEQRYCSPSKPRVPMKRCSPRSPKRVRRSAQTPDGAHTPKSTTGGSHCQNHEDGHHCENLHPSYRGELDSIFAASLNPPS